MKFARGSRTVALRARFVHSAAIWAAFVLLGLLFVFASAVPLTARAADLDSITSVSNAGVVVLDGATVSIDDVGSVSNSWTFDFSWPTNVPNAFAFFAVAKGTFGALDGATPVEGVNFGSNYQQWPAGANSITKSIPFASLGAEGTQSGTYTVIIAQLNSGFATAATMQWFASGGSAGTAPANYAFLTFEYNAESAPEELPGALASITHEGRLIAAGDSVYRKEVMPASADPSQWSFDFAWPNAVPNLQAGFYVFRGTFGNLEGGAAVEGTNYAANFQVWPAGHNVISKSFGLPALSNVATEPGTYTVMIAERNALSLSPQAEADWFASGGTAGTGPKKYSLLTFEFPKYRECCSSVVFLPGIKGSVLRTGTDTIWPPTAFGSDIQKLALTQEGESVNPIVVDGVLDNFYGTPIYGGFSSFMDGLVSAGTVADWEPIPYDWRYGPEQILEDGVIRPSGTLDVQAEVERLAADSDTGQVTIVAHSMGGLLGKEIIRELDSEGGAGLIDSFVMVGSPQLGTPQAIGSLLHGTKESIWPGIFFTPGTVREVAQNMQSSYNLLPSPEYFSRVIDPVITFNEGAFFTQEWRDFWGLAIGNYAEFLSFATAEGVGRVDPAPSQLFYPEILRADLMQNSRDLHAWQDTYIFPPNIRAVQVAGWGIETIKSIEYRNEHSLPGYRPVFTVEGDNTVVYPSAVSSFAETYYFNLDLYRDPDNKRAQHRDLLGTDSVKELISQVINEESIHQIDFISLTKPETTDVAQKIAVSTHSPVVLGAYDNLGRFTGIDPNQDLSGDFVFITENIPGSSFLVVGESQYLFLPKEGTYNFVFKGTGTGPTTVETGTFVNDAVVPVASYTDIPVIFGTQATFTIDSSAPEVADIELDTDGDGSIDSIVSPDRQELTVQELLAQLRTEIQALTVKDKVKINLLKKVDRIEKKIAKSKNVQAGKVVTNLGKLVTKKAQKGKITDSEADAIAALLEQIEQKL